MKGLHVMPIEQFFGCEHAVSPWRPPHAAMHTVDGGELVVGVAQQT